MKTNLFILFLVFLAFGCTTENIETESELNLVSNPNMMGSKLPVCHNTNGTYDILMVNVNAINAHVAHGDVVLLDGDGDGYVTEENACVPYGDCDDTDASVYPGAEEICGDGVDNNCDGQVDEDCGTPVYDCPCFTYEEALNYAMETATNFYDENCYLGGVGFQQQGGPDWGVGSFIFNIWCTDFDGSQTVISSYDRIECEALLRAVQEEVRTLYCGAPYN